MNGLSAQRWNAYEPGGAAVEFGRDGMLVGGGGFREWGGACNGNEPSLGTTTLS
jgi:hypothetical protein